MKERRYEKEKDNKKTETKQEKYTKTKETQKDNLTNIPNKHEMAKRPDNTKVDAEKKKEGTWPGNITQSYHEKQNIARETKHGYILKIRIKNLF